METSHLVIGAGEIGKSIKKAFDGVLDISIRDISSDVVGQFNYLHICFPYFDGFIKTVEMYDKLYSPKTIIIHSTLPVGTIRALGEKAVHIPIRGKHPKLAESIKTFRLYIGGNDIDRVVEVAEIFNLINKDTYILDWPPETTEILKLMDTSYYAWNILFEKEMHKICHKYNIPFEVVYQDANRSYNDGYAEMGNLEVVRPVLDHIKGQIGGHCLVNNAKLFDDTYINKLILDKNKEFLSEE